VNISQVDIMSSDIWAKGLGCSSKRWSTGTGPRNSLLADPCSEPISLLEPGKDSPASNSRKTVAVKEAAIVLGSSQARRMRAAWWLTVP
jgi:hypothetical protein